jgi:hypothetical protein
MMKALISKDGKVIETQSDARAGTLLANAKNYGLEGCEEREVTPEELAVLLDTPEARAAKVLQEVGAKLVEIDKQSIRAIREWVVKQPDAPAVLIDYETEAAAKRSILQEKT